MEEKKRKAADEEVVWYFKSDLRLKGRISSYLIVWCSLMGNIFSADDDQGWTEYDSTDSDLIERAYKVLFHTESVSWFWKYAQAGKNKVKLNDTYTINLKDMLQYR